MRLASSPSQTKQGREARGVKVLERRTKKKGKPDVLLLLVLKSQDCSHGNRVYLWSCQKYHFWPQPSIGWRLSILKCWFSIVSTFVIVLPIFDLEIIILFLLCASFDSACHLTYFTLSGPTAQPRECWEMVEDTYFKTHNTTWGKYIHTYRQCWGKLLLK